MARGILPLFVFDGPHRPSWKRGNHVGGGGGVRKLEREFRTMIELLGGHWRRAEGEAEADLAAFVLSGEIDAVITDDVDTLLFRSPMVRRLRCLLPGRDL
jgi:Holliday junction resolvase YEN1